MSAMFPKPEPQPTVARETVKLAFYPECHHTVMRNGHAEACERLAVGLRLDFSESIDGDPYPVCARHVSKLRGCMVPLIALMGAKP